MGYTVHGTQQCNLRVAYPPDSPEDVGLELVAPNGTDGGAVWTHPRFTDTLIWSPEQSRLVAIVVRWIESKGHLLAQPIEKWLELVARDLPETRTEIQEKLESERLPRNPMRQAFVSPHYNTQEKLEQPGVEDLIDLLEDRVKFLVLEPVREALKIPFGFSAAFCVLLTYFEGIWIYISGRDSQGSSRRFFENAFVEVFDSSGPSEDLLRRIATVFYRDARCGFFHDGMARDRIYFGRLEGPMKVTLPKVDGRLDEAGDIQSIIVDPLEALKYVEGHFGKLVESLRDPTNTEERSRFEAICRRKWDWESGPRIVVD